MMNAIHGRIQFMFGVTQSSVVGPLLFNIFVSDLFLFTDYIDIASRADDNTPYTTSSKTNLTIEKLDQCYDSLFTRF